MTTDAMSVTTQHQVEQPDAVGEKRSEVASVSKGSAWGKPPPSSSVASITNSSTMTTAATATQDEPSSPVHQKAYASSTANKEAFKENISPRLETASAATTNGKFVEAPVPRVNPWKVRQNQSQVTKSPQMPPQQQHFTSAIPTTTSSPAPSHSVWSAAHDSNTKNNNAAAPSNTTAPSTTKGAPFPSPVLKAGASSSVTPNPPIALNDTESWPTPADDIVKEKKQAETVSSSSTNTKTTKKPEWIKYEGAEIVYNTPAAGKSARGGNGGSGGSGGGDRKGYKRSGANRSGSREAESNDGGKAGAGAVAGKHRRAQSVSGGARSNNSPGKLNKAEQPPAESGATVVDSVAPDAAKMDTQQPPTATKLNSTTNEPVVHKNGVIAKDVHAKQQYSSVPTTPSDRSSSPGNKHPNIQFGTIDASSSTTSSSVINGPQMSGTHQHSQRSNLRSDKISRNSTTNSGTTTNNGGSHQNNGVTYRPNARSQSLGHQFFQNPTSAQGAAGGFPIQYPLQPPFANQPMYGSLPPRAHSMSMYGYPGPGMAPMPPLMDMASMQLALSQMGYYDVMASRDIILRQM